MPTLILKQKITKGYDHWLAAFDGAEDLRNDKYGIKTIYRGQDVNDKDTIHVVMYTPNMDVIQEHMEMKRISSHQLEVTQIQKQCQCQLHQID